MIGGGGAYITIRRGECAATADDDLVLFGIKDGARDELLGQTPVVYARLHLVRDFRFIELGLRDKSLRFLGVLNSIFILAGYKGLKAGAAGGGGPLYAAIGGLLGMVLMLTLAKKLTWLREYTLGIAMLIGMAVAVILV